MKLTKSKVEFDSKLHEYWLGDEQLMGYTSSIGAWMYPHAYDGVPEEVMNRAAERGTAIHNGVQFAYDEGVKSAVHEVNEGVRLLAENDLHVEAWEWIVDDGKRFASAIDILCKDGSLIDIKTTSELHVPEVSLQLSCYAYWLEKMNKGCGFEVSSLYALWLPKEQYGRCSLVKIPRIPSPTIKKVIKAYLSGEGNEQLLPAVAPKMPTVFNRFVHQYQLMQSKMDELKKQESQVKEKILEIFTSMGYKAYKDDDIIITRVLPYEKTSIDTERLKTVYSQVYQDCVKKSMTEESVRITLRKTKK